VLLLTTYIPAYVMSMLQRRRLLMPVQFNGLSLNYFAARIVFIFACNVAHTNEVYCTGKKLLQEILKVRTTLTSSASLEVKLNRLAYLDFLKSKYYPELLRQYQNHELLESEWRLIKTTMKEATDVVRRVKAEGANLISSFSTTPKAVHLPSDVAERVAQRIFVFSERRRLGVPVVPTAMRLHKGGADTVFSTLNLRKNNLLPYCLVQHKKFQNAEQYPLMTRTGYPMQRLKQVLEVVSAAATAKAQWTPDTLMFQFEFRLTIEFMRTGQYEENLRQMCQYFRESDFRNRSGITNFVVAHTPSMRQFQTILAENEKNFQSLPSNTMPVLEVPHRPKPLYSNRNSKIFKGSKSARRSSRSNLSKK